MKVDEVVELIWNSISLNDEVLEDQGEDTLNARTSDFEDFNIVTEDKGLVISINGSYFSVVVKECEYIHV